MENIKKDLDGQGFLFNKDDYLKPIDVDYVKSLEDKDIEFIDDSCNSLDEMDRKADSHLFGNKPL